MNTADKTKHHRAAAEPSAPAAESPTTETFVVFTVDHVRYALPVASVQRTLPYPLVTRLPTVGRHVLGVFQHAGRVIAMWDLHTLFAGGDAPPQTPWVVVSEHDGHVLGLTVDRVDDIVSVRGANLRPEGAVPAAAASVVLGTLHPPEPDDADPEPADSIEALVSGATDRGAEQLTTLAPVHLIDLAALRRLGTGEAT